MLRAIFAIFIGIASLKSTAEEIMGVCGNTDSALNCVEYLRNYDGDTLTVNIPTVHPLLGRDILVRVEGVDSPEIEGKNQCERLAARRVQSQVQKWLKAARRIDLKNVQRDKYFRVLADVKIDGSSLSTMLLDNGYAVPYDGGTKHPVDWCNLAK